MAYKGLKILNKILLGSLIFILLINTKTLNANKEPLIRVLIAKEKKLRVRADKSIPFQIRNEDLFRNNVKGINIKVINNNLLLSIDKENSKTYEMGANTRLILKSRDRRGLWIGGKRYKGDINIMVLNNQILVLNILGIEQYLNSVVGSEMPHKWPIEALKAQAIASRTYALKKIGNDLYDIDSTQKDQVYNGLESRTYKTIKAVKNTRSLVITHNQKLINALFHSSSGGITENSQDVWKNKFSYLKSVRDFDQDNPKRLWRKYFTEEQLLKLFPNIGGIKDIKIKQISDSGRIKNLKIFGQLGMKEIKGTKFRQILGLKSTLFRFKFLNDYNNNKIDNINDLAINSSPVLMISGMGAGHGVGMSQWGAKYMASKGYKAKEILKYFYEGVEIKPFKNIYK